MAYYLKNFGLSVFSTNAACSNGVFQVSKISLIFFLMVQKLIGSNNEVNFERVLMMWVKSFAQFYFLFVDPLFYYFTRY